MGQVVVTGAMISCSFGAAPASLIGTPTSRVTVEGMPVAVISDIKPVANVPPFGMCSSLANPTVAAATSAALGVLTPMPCVPVIPAPWMPGALRTTFGGQPALVSGSSCSCAYGGVIQITNPQTTRTQAS